MNSELRKHLKHISFIESNMLGDGNESTVDQFLEFYMEMSDYSGLPLETKLKFHPVDIQIFSSDWDILLELNASDYDRHLLSHNFLDYYYILTRVRVGNQFYYSLRKINWDGSNASLDNKVTVPLSMKRHTENSTIIREIPEDMTTNNFVKFINYNLRNIFIHDTKILTGQAS